MDLFSIVCFSHYSVLTIIFHWQLFTFYRLPSCPFILLKAIQQRLFLYSFLLSWKQSQIPTRLSTKWAHWRFTVVRWSPILGQSLNTRKRYVCTQSSIPLANICRLNNLAFWSTSIHSHPPLLKLLTGKVKYEVPVL